MVFFFGDFPFRLGEQIDLMKILPLAQIHKRLFQAGKVIVGQVVLAPGTGIAVTLHKILPLHIVFPQAVDDDMHMDVAAAIVPVRVGADKGLMSGEIFPAIFQPKPLCLLPGQPALITVFRVEADDVVVGFDLVISSVFVEAGVQFPAFHIKRKRVAFHPVKVIFFPKLQVPVFIRDWFSGIFIMLKNEVTLSLPVVRILTRYVFEYRHENPPPSLPLHISFHKFVQCTCLSPAAFPENGCHPD